MATKRRTPKPARAQTAKNTTRARHHGAAGPSAVLATPVDVGTTTRGEPSLTIVGIGASAGGMEAMQRVLQKLTPDSGLAYVLVQHLAPNHESLLAELLRSSSAIPVVQAAERMPVRPNRLHVIPPNVQMTLQDGYLHLAPRPSDRTQYNAIDSFFESMVRFGEHRSVGIVLSGSSSDGAAGLREIKAAGGVTIAQEPSTARYDAMPRAAIATGAVDLVLSPEAIATELIRLGEHPFLRSTERTLPNEMQISEPQFERLFYLLRTASGVDFGHYKLPTIKRRLQRRMALQKLTDVDKYLRFLDGDSVEVQNLYRDILIHVTKFFRDPESFIALKSTVFPRIVEQAAAGRPIRIWVPGCATGEEAYSIAITLLEHLGDDANSAPVQVFATDVSEDAIERARTGVYPEGIAADVPADRLRRYFSRTDGQYRVSKVVRDCCIFARQDLTRDPPFSKLDLIVCRNVLIYLGPRLQRKLMGVFHYALQPSGILMLGSTESVGAHADLFGVLDKKHKIYARSDGRSRLEHDFMLAPDGAFERDRTRMITPSRLSREGDIQSEVTRLLLGRYSPPGVVVDDNFQIVQTRGRTGRFLELSTGDATLNLLKMAREGLLHGLRTALRNAKKTGRPARREGLLVEGGGSRPTDLQVIPFADGNDVQYFLVTFEEPPGPRGPGTTARHKAQEREGTRGSSPHPPAGRADIEP